MQYGTNESELQARNAVKQKKQEESEDERKTAPPDIVSYMILFFLLKAAHFINHMANISSS